MTGYLPASCAGSDWVSCLAGGGGGGGGGCLAGKSKSGFVKYKYHTLH